MYGLRTSGKSNIFCYISKDEKKKGNQVTVRVSLKSDSINHTTEEKSPNITEVSLSPSNRNANKFVTDHLL